MAIIGEELARMSDEELRKMFDRPIGNCLYSKCRKEVRSLQEHRYVPAGVYHDNCYFEEWGDEIEKHPIGIPGRRGIGGSNLQESDLEVATA